MKKKRKKSYFWSSKSRLAMGVYEQSS